MINIAIFASGNGSNAQRIIDFYRESEKVRVAAILSNKTDAYVLQRANDAGIETLVFTAAELRETTKVIDFLIWQSIDFIVLSGFLLLIPKDIINKYPLKIINIHPALLPAYGGKGMFGMNVHKTVVENNENESGITIHYVNACYDEGNIIFQSRCPVFPEDTPEKLADRVHELEYKYFIIIINQEITSIFSVK